MRFRLKVTVMARPRAPDYEDKSKLILDRSAILFARHGYDRASITMIADACGMSKALLYHYYADKLQILLGIIGSHLDDLLRATAPERCAGSSARTTLYAMSEAVLDTYRNADAHHQVQLNHMDLLAPEQQDALRDLERRLVARFAVAIDAALSSPGSQDALLKPLTMSLFGMFNWAYMWFPDTGPLTRPAYARLAADLVISGAHVTSLPADADPASGGKGPAAAAPAVHARAVRARRPDPQTAS